ARLAEIEAVERLVGEQERLRRQQAEREQGALALPLRQRPDRRVEDRREIQAPYHVVSQVGAAAEKTDDEIERPLDALRRPRRDGVRQVEERRRSIAGRERPAVGDDGACVGGQDTSQTFEQ